MSSTTPDRQYSRAFEDAWSQAWAQFELRDGFWFGVLFGAYPFESQELIERSTNLLRPRGRTVRRLDLTEGSLNEVLATLTAPAPAGLGATWVVPRQTARGQTSGEIWRRLLRRLNERRDAVRLRHTAGLLLLCGAEALPLVREEAPRPVVVPDAHGSLGLQGH